MFNVEIMVSNEKEALMKNYSAFCNILKNEDALLPKFVEENIITQDQLNDIQSMSAAWKRGHAILVIVSGAVNSGQNKGFLSMLRIMKNFGKCDTQLFAKQIERELGICDTASHDSK